MYAILIPYIETGNGDCLLLEVRSEHVPQPGEVCFPGGKIEAGETPAAAALRETCEELGICPSSIEIMEELAPEKMEDGRLIYPVTARLSPSALSSVKPSCAEVASIFLLPFSWLRAHKPATYRLSGAAADFTILPALLQGYLSHYAPFENTHHTFYWEYEGHGIWGMTARVIRRLLPFDVICAGQAVVDCITRGKEPHPYKKNVYRADSIHLQIGGDAINEACALADMGCSVSVICGLGDDFAGNLIRSELRRRQIDTTRISSMDGSTPIANLTIASDGGRTSVSSRATLLPGYHVLPAHIGNARILSLASIFRPPLNDPEILQSIAADAHAKGMLVCADTKLPLSGDAALSDYRVVLSNIDFIFPNEAEATYYSDTADLLKAAEIFQSYGVKNVIIKTGASGCFVKTPTEHISLPAVPVSKVIDTTGAGDAFVAGFLSGLLLEKDTIACARLGLEAAAKKISLSS